VNLAPIPFYQFSVFVGRFRKRTMAALKGYFDDSTQTGQCVVVAGFVGDGRCLGDIRGAVVGGSPALRCPIYAHEGDSRP
jgi:hypothetical protein